MSGCLYRARYCGGSTSARRSSRRIAPKSAEGRSRFTASPSSTTLCSSNPAISLLKLLQRNLEASANEFRTLKDLKSPNTWIAIPAGMRQFMYRHDSNDAEAFRLNDEALWQEALARTLNAGRAMVPPIASYQSFPGRRQWVRSARCLDLAFDDRYFMHPMSSTCSTPCSSLRRRSACCRLLVA